MNIVEERKKIIDIFDKYEKKQGRRKLDIPYDRSKEISKELNYRWGYRTMYRFEYLIKNDLENNIYTYGLLKNNWRVNSVYSVDKKGYFIQDIKNGGKICKQVLNNEIGNLNEIISKIKNEYHLSSNCYIYVVSIKDNGHVFPYKKIGLTLNLSQRMNQFSLNSPFEYELLGLWEVELNKQTYIEKRLHKKFSHIQKKTEWFTDENNTLLFDVRNELKQIEDIIIEEVDVNKFSFT
jgi:hypothetical protein